MSLESRIPQLTEQALQRSVRAVERAGQTAAAAAKRGAPVGATGDLRAGIEWKHGGGRGLQGRVRSTDHKTKWLEYGTVHMPARPFLGPAKRAAAAGFIANMERAYE